MAFRWTGRAVDSSSGLHAFDERERRQESSGINSSQHAKSVEGGSNVGSEARMTQQEVEECESCKRIVDINRLLQTPLGYYVCEDAQECIAEFSGWNKPP